MSDRVLDLRKCEYDGADLSAKTLSGALMSDASFKNAKMQEVVMSKVSKQPSPVGGYLMAFGGERDETAGIGVASHPVNGMGNLPMQHFRVLGLVWIELHNI